MSAIDDWRRQRDRSRRMREDAEQLATEKGIASLEIKTGGVFYHQHVDLLSAVRTVLSSPEGVRLLTEIADRAERASLDAALTECRSFLEEHLASEVLES